MSSFPLINCLEPVLVVNPKLAEFVLKSDCYFIDGVKHTIHNEDRYHILTYPEVASKVLRIPFAKNLSSKYLDSFCISEQEKLLSRLHNYVDSCFLLNSQTGESFPIYIFVPCGHCDLCKSKILNSYIQRCVFQVEQDSQPAYFVTLTYNRKYNPVFANRQHITLFKKRLSKRFGYPLKFFVVSEYGKDHNRPHYHMLIFGIKQSPFMSRECFDESVVRNIQFCWREPERHLNGFGYVSFADYSKRYPLTSKRPDGYDPYSYGYIQCSIVKSASSAVGYCLKYIFKDIVSDVLSDKPDTAYSKNLLNGFRYYDEKDNYVIPVTEDDVKVEFSSFRSCSCNLGLEFAKKLVSTKRVNGKYQYLPFNDLVPVEVTFSGYYLRKLFPTLSELIPSDVRKAAINLLSTSFDLLYSQDKLSYDKMKDKDLRHIVSKSVQMIQDKYPFLFDFNDDVLPYSRLKRKIKSISRYSVEEYEHDYVRFNDEMLDTLFLFIDSYCIIDNFVSDYSSILSQLKSRSDYINELKPRSRSELFEAAAKFRKDIKVSISKSSL